MESPFAKDLDAVFCIQGKPWVCRLCHKDVKEGEAPEVINGHDTLTIETESSTKCVTLFEILRRITNFTTETAELPHQFCSKCCEQLLSHHLFGLYCVEQEKRLLDLINPLSHNIFDYSNIKSELDVKKRSYYLFAFNPIEESTKGKIEQSELKCDSDVENESESLFIFNPMKKSRKVKLMKRKHDIDTNGWPCEFCGKMFTNTQTFRNHRYFCKNKGKNLINIPCEFCSRLCKGRDILRQHHFVCKKRDKNLVPDPKVKFICDQCNFTFYSKGRLNAHMKTVHVARNLPCQICRKMFKTEKQLKYHLINHSDNKNRSPCEFCGKSFVRRQTLQNHRSFCKYKGKNPINFLRCEFCNRLCKGKVCLRQHRFVCKKRDKNLVPDPAVKYPCDVCNFTFFNKGRLNTHMKTVHVVPSIPCKICKRKFKTQKLLNAHLITHTDKKRSIYKQTTDVSENGWPCEFCGRFCKGPESLKQHRFVCKKRDKNVLPDPDEIFICDLCNVIRYSKARISAHMKTVHVAYTLPCEVCGKLFKTLKQLRDHAVLHSNENQRCFCEFCGRMLATRQSLKNHRIVCKKRDKKVLPDPHLKYTCDQCSVTFFSKGHLHAHMKNVHVESKVPCEVCGKSFKTFQHLKHHLVSHSGDRKFKCRFCDNRFKTNNALVYHERIHTGEKPFPCSECDLSFLSASRRKYHFLAKHCEKLAECNICSMKFPTNANVRYHMKRVHFKEPKGSRNDDLTIQPKMKVVSVKLIKKKSEN